MNPPLVPEVQKSKIVPWILFLCLSIFIIATGFIGLKTYNSFFTKAPQNSAPANNRAIEMGRLYYSAVLPSQFESQLFEVDFITKTPTLLKNTVGIHQMTPSEKGVEAVSYYDKEGKSFIEIVATNKDGVKETVYVQPPSTTTKIGKISWNEDRTQLLYEVHTVSESPTMDVPVAIYQYNLNDVKSTKLIEGRNPTYYDAETFLYIQNDGVYGFDVLASSSEKQSFLVKKFDVDEKFMHATMLFYPDKKKLLVTHPSIPAVDIYTVEKSENKEVIFSTTVRKEQSMMSPVFSPDGNFIAYFEAGIATEPNEMALSVIDVKNGLKVSRVRALIDMTKPFIISFWK